MEMNIDIGTRIRDLRKEQKISISELAEKSNVSSGLISQLERNLINPSISSLWNISKSLGVSIGYFFDEDESHESAPIVKRNNRKRIVTSDSNAIYELLSPDLNRKIEFLSVTIDQDDCSSRDLITHDGEECGIVIKGKLMIKTEKEDYILEEGDSIYFDSTIPHRYINIGEEVCVSIWAMTPPSF